MCSREPAVSNRVPKLAPIPLALSLALEFESLAAHSSSTFRANPIQDIGNNFRNRLKTT